ncbi:hypothetical protein [Sphingomonas sp. M1A8_2b]
MGNTAGLPRINEVAAYLNKFAPTTAGELKAKGETYSALLTPGVIGGEETAQAPNAEREGLKARAQVTVAALDHAVHQCGPTATAVLARLHKARSLQFAAAALSTITASGVIASAFVSATTTIIAGVITLAASVVGLFSDIVVLGGQGQYDKLRDAAQTLIKDEGIAAVSRSTLAAIAQTDFNPDDLKDLLQQGNGLFAEILQALSDARL